MFVRSFGGCSQMFLQWNNDDKRRRVKKTSHLLIKGCCRMSSAEDGTTFELPDALSGKYKGSFAYVTIKDRLPVILTKVIDCVYRERHVIANRYGESSGEDVKATIGRLSELRNEMVTNKQILPIRSNAPDVHLWNAYLEKQHEVNGFKPAWFDSPWLYSECYLYRRIKEAFELSSFLQEYDPFHFEKKTSLLSLLKEASILASTLQKSLNLIDACKDTSILCEEFVKFAEISLWGNQCDLSISAGNHEMRDSSSLLDLKTLKKRIICNEVETLWNVIQTAASKYNDGARVDLVLDNAGFELFTDLCLLEFLDAAKLLSEAHLYVKVIPWFVSDTLQEDIDFLLETLSNQQDSLLAMLSTKWRENINNGKWIVEREKFWTLPHDYSEMKDVDPDLYNKLTQSNIIIFKGDLNYRKLTSDRMWKDTTPFVTALRGFLPAPLCSLRTIKCDVVTGLKPGVKEPLDQKNASWMLTGKYAVIQCVADEVIHCTRR